MLLQEARTLVTSHERGLLADAGTHHLAVMKWLLARTGDDERIRLSRAELESDPEIVMLVGHQGRGAADDPASREMRKPVALATFLDLMLADSSWPTALNVLAGVDSRETRMALGVLGAETSARVLEEAVARREAGGRRFHDLEAAWDAARPELVPRVAQRVREHPELFVELISDEAAARLAPPPPPLPAPGPSLERRAPAAFAACALISVASTALWLFVTNRGRSPPAWPTTLALMLGASALSVAFASSAVLRALGRTRFGRVGGASMIACIGPPAAMFIFLLIMTHHRGLPLIVAWAISLFVAPAAIIAHHVRDTIALRRQRRMLSRHARPAT